MKKQTGKVIKLSKEENDRLTATPFRVAGDYFKKSEEFRRKSLKSDIRIN